MKKIWIVTIGVGIAIIIAAGSAYSLQSENVSMENPKLEGNTEQTENKQTEGKSISIELEESIGIKTNP